MQLATLVESNK